MSNIEGKQKKHRKALIKAAVVSVLALIVLMTAVIVPACTPVLVPPSTAVPTFESKGPENTPAPTAAPVASGRSFYDITAELSDDGASLACRERLVYVNSSDDPLTEIVLNVYPNAFLTQGRGHRRGVFLGVQR